MTSTKASVSVLDVLESLRAEPHTYSRHEAMLDLVSAAARRATSVEVGRRSVKLERGELVTSEPALAARWGWNRRQVRALFALLCAKGVLLTSRIPGTVAAAGTKLTLIDFDGYAKARTKLDKAPDKDPDKANGGPPNEIRARANQAADRGAYKAPPQTPRSSPVVLRSLSSPATNPGGLGGGDAIARDKAGGNGGNGPASPELVAYAEVLVDRLNVAQLQHHAIDASTYRPLRVQHMRTLEAAAALRDAGVPVSWASDYVWMEGQRYKPTPAAPQIASLAYLRAGCIRDWHAVDRLQQRRAAAVTSHANDTIAHRERRGGAPERVGSIAGDVLQRFEQDWRTAMGPRDVEETP